MIRLRKPTAGRIPLALHLAEPGLHGHLSKAELAARAGPGFRMADGPEPPEHLAPLAQAFWRKQYPLLDEVGLLKEGQMGLFERYCSIWALLRDLDDQLAKAKRIKDKLPLYRELRNQQMIFVRINAEFGLSPVMEGKVGGSGPPTVDPMDNAMFATESDPVN